MPMAVCACLCFSGACCCCRPARGVLFLIAGASHQQGDARFLICSIPITSASGLVYCQACRRCWPFCLAAIVSACRACGGRCAGCWCYRESAAVAVAADAMAERRISLLVDHCAAGRGWLCPVVAVNQPSPGRLFSPDHLLMALFCRS